MADNTPFGNINIEAGSTERSASWYQRQVRSYASHLNSPAELYDSDLGRFETKLEVGQMYLFEYTPKHADTLPYYDNFPLVVIADAIPNGFSGVNLHYLRPMARAALLDKLMPAWSDIGAKSQLASSWSTLRNFSKFPEARGATKKYLGSQAGRLFRINPAHWKSAIFLPVQMFKGAGLQKIYKDTMERPERKKRGSINVGRI